MSKRHNDSNNGQPHSKMSKNEREAIRRQRLQTEYQKLRSVVEEIKPYLDVQMQQTDILEQARKLIKELQRETLELKAKLLLAEAQKHQAFNDGRQAFLNELLVAQLAACTAIPQQSLPRSPQDDSSDANSQPSSSN